MMSRLNSSLPAGIFCVLLSFFACKNNPSEGNISGDSDRNLLPTGVVPTEAALVDVHCWTDGTNFYVAGLATNEADGPEFRRVWLHLLFSDAAGNAVKLNNKATATVALLSEAIPPRGMSSFFAGWPLSAFSATPDSVRLSDASGLMVPAGAILLAENVGGIKMIVTPQGEKPDSTRREQNWQVTGTINNPLDRTARAFACEALIYGTDNKLWFTQWLTPLDSSRVLQENRTGPLQPGEKRQFGILVTYDGLPKQLQDIRIGRVDVLASEDRE